MIWIDSSFAVEWLYGTERAGRVDLSGEPLGILPMQYVEFFTFFLKRDHDPIWIANELEPLELIHPERRHLQKAAILYVDARRKKSKASLADAVLAAVAQDRREKVAALDNDFASLGLKKKGGFWYPS